MTPFSDKNSYSTIIEREKNLRRNNTSMKILLSLYYFEF